METYGSEWALSYLIEHPGSNWIDVCLKIEYEEELGNISGFLIENKNGFLKIKISPQQSILIPREGILYVDMVTAEEIRENKLINRNKGR